MEETGKPTSGTDKVTSYRPEKFTLFPDLPAEIRVQIFKEALSIPQKVVYEVISTPFSSNKAFLKRASPLHPLFYVSRETREEALSFYLKTGDKAKEDVWDVWRYFRFGVDICELRNEAKVPWTFLVAALGREESLGLEIVMGGFRSQIDVR